MSATISTGIKNPANNPYLHSSRARRISVVFISHTAEEVPIKGISTESQMDSDTVADKLASHLASAFRTGPMNLALPTGVPQFLEWQDETAQPMTPSPGRMGSCYLDAERPFRQGPENLKPVEFSVQAPGAKVVQLAAEFTDWDECPINMVHFEDGYWSTTVPLPAGTYPYRYLVDGEWYDDPRAVRHEAKGGHWARTFIKVK